MVVMALDHTRDFICNIPFEPEDIDQTWAFYFLVRWVTHFCAPAFFLLAGVGAYLYGTPASPAELQSFLVTRGIWLVVLEFTVIGFAWTFHPGWGMFGVICCLGLSMILLAAFVRLPRWLVMAVALIVIATHDLFDGLKARRLSRRPMAAVCAASFRRRAYRRVLVFVLFPLIPWCAVTLLGFSMGSLFETGQFSLRPPHSAYGQAWAHCCFSPSCAPPTLTAIPARRDRPLHARRLAPMPTSPRPSSCFSTSRSIRHRSNICS
jgi:uncharacterized membrane protein